MSKGDLLVVDDDDDIVATLGEVLGAEGYGVRSAANGEEGLKQLSVRFPDVVLLDVEMPIMDGPAMSAQMLIADCGRESIPIVLLTGVADSQRIAARVGTPYVLEKPYTLDRLLELVERALRERTPPRRPWAGGHASP